MIHNIKKIQLLFVFTMLLFCISLVFTFKVEAGFRFAALGDSRGNNTELTKLSNQLKTLPSQPAFIIFPGDLIPTNSSLSVPARFQAWKTAMDGGSGNGNLLKTFASRGNHDLPDTASWLSAFQFGPISDPNSVAAKTGVSNYSALNDDLTYSFDYQNSHFVALDAYGNANTITSAQVAWVDNDLRSAAGRGLKHAFLFWHGPLYTINGHMSSVPVELATMLNNHPIVTALFAGHEHVLGHTTLDKSRVPQFTNRIIEQFVTGGAGAGFYSCTAGRSDFCQTVNGFTTIDVISDTQIVAAFYKDGSNTPIFERTYTKGLVSSPPPGTSTPVPTVKPTISPKPTTVPTSPPTGYFTPDVNSDGKVNIIDIGIVIDNYGSSNPTNPRADVNVDGKVNIIDIGIIIDNYNKSVPVAFNLTTPKP